MSDDPNKMGLDRRLMAVDEMQKARFWTQPLGCALDGLREAVGDSAAPLRYCSADNSGGAKT